MDPTKCEADKSTGYPRSWYTHQCTNPYKYEVEVRGVVRRLCGVHKNVAENRSGYVSTVQRPVPLFRYETRLTFDRTYVATSEERARLETTELVQRIRDKHGLTGQALVEVEYDGSPAINQDELDAWERGVSVETIRSAADE
ncbi:MAG: hypothetical protein AB7Q01_08535 [Gammaproteobacteria bacterium]